MEDTDLQALEAMEPREYLARLDEIVDEGMERWVDSNFHRAFRKAAPRYSPFTQAVLRLQDLGFSVDDARWAAGQATSRLRENAPFAEVLETALVTLEEYRHAA